MKKKMFVFLTFTVILVFSIVQATISANEKKCQTLLLFDWAGNLLNTYAIDTPLTHVCYETEENAIYAIGYTPEAALVKISL